MLAKMLERVIVGGAVLLAAYHGVTAMVEPVAASLNASATKIEDLSDGRIG